MSHQEPPTHHEVQGTHWDGLASQTRSYRVHAVCGVLVNSSCPMQHVGWSCSGGWDVTMQPAILGSDETLASLCSRSVLGHH